MLEAFVWTNNIVLTASLMAFSLVKTI